MCFECVSILIFHWNNLFAFAEIVECQNSAVKAEQGSVLLMPNKNLLAECLWYLLCLIAYKSSLHCPRFQVTRSFGKSQCQYCSRAHAEKHTSTQIAGILPQCPHIFSVSITKPTSQCVLTFIWLTPWFCCLYSPPGPTYKPISEFTHRLKSIRTRSSNLLFP